MKAVTQVPAASLAEANEKLYTSLTYGIALEQDCGGGRKSHTVRFFDFDRPERNEWVVTRQYRVLGSKKHVIPDVVAFVNGLPLAVIECKSPTIGDAWKAEAVKQLRRYQEADSRWKDQGAPRLFEAAQMLIGTCGERAVYGTVGTPGRFFLEWKEPHPLTVEQLGERLGRAPTRQDVLLYGLLEPRNLLDVVRNFVAFEVDGGRTVRKLTRYRQFIAVNEAMRRIRTARRPSERGGVVWHTQGSGKSLTMLWLALKLRRDEAQEQPAVVIVTDRTKLDRQIAGVFTACGFPNPERADSVRDLRGILEHPTGRTVMTTIQKFQEITGQSLDQVFDRVFADRTEDERAAIRQRFATEQAVAGAPRRIEAVCLDLIDHFTRFIAPNRFKAQIVAASRHAAVTVKETLDGPESALVMPAGHNDEARLARWRLCKASTPACGCSSPRTCAPRSTSRSGGSASRWTCCCPTRAPSRTTPTCAGSARSGEPRALATATTGSTCRAAARRCAR